MNDEETEMTSFDGLQTLRAAVVALFSLLSAVVVAQPQLSYQEARWDPLHFKPAIDSATDEQCLACHREIIERRVSSVSQAGVAAKDTLAWYQTLETYSGEQDTFHRRHLVNDFARQVMQLRCNTCHQGNDPRDETANSSADGQPDLIQRKHVDPDVCLMCHGQFNNVVMGVPGKWSEHGKLFGDNCLTCHQAIRTKRHEVNFLNPDAIEEAGRQSSDACYGCHGGRAWYRTHYPYARHPWPGGGDLVPEWAKDRATSSNPRFTQSTATPAAQ
jgi:hypothetical protein